MYMGCHCRVLDWWSMSIKYSNIKRVITKKIWLFFDKFLILFLFHSQHHKSVPPSIIFVDSVGSASFTFFNRKVLNADFFVEHISPSLKSDIGYGVNL